MTAFLKKEWLEQLRSGKLLLLGILFTLFGVMNPAIAKLTPLLLEMVSDSMAQTGLVVTGVTVTAMDSWVQFFKNVPMALIVFVLLESGIFTREYQQGTLIPVLTKGLPRYQVLLSKTVVLAALWTAGYWLCFGITYGYNAWFWDNSVAKNLIFAVTAWYLTGLWTLSLMVLFSTLSAANTGVLLGTGAVVLGGYLLTLLPKLKSWSPALLMEAAPLLYGSETPGDYTKALLTTGCLTLSCLAAGIPVFNKKSI